MLLVSKDSPNLLRTFCSDNDKRITYPSYLCSHAWPITNPGSRGPQSGWSQPGEGQAEKLQGGRRGYFFLLTIAIATTGLLIVLRKSDLPENPRFRVVCLGTFSLFGVLFWRGMSLRRRDVMQKGKNIILEPSCSLWRRLKSALNSRLVFYSCRLLWCHTLAAQLFRQRIWALGACIWSLEALTDLREFLHSGISWTFLKMKPERKVQYSPKYHKLADSNISSFSYYPAEAKW